jgi:peroxisomal membrane protein 4
MSTVLYIVNNFLNNPSYHASLSLIKGLRQGIVYGAKIRFAHSLVQAFLFRHEPWSQRIRFIIRMTYLHAKNLGLFVFFYKTLRTIVSSVFHLSKPWCAFLCAFIVGYFVFHEHNSINEQIVLYLLSRIIVGLARYAQKRAWLPNTKRSVFPWFAAFIWGIVLWLFECHRETLQPSLTRSMIYLYENSNRWSSWNNFLLRDLFL